MTSSLAPFSAALSTTSYSSVKIVTSERCQSIGLPAYARRPGDTVWTVMSCDVYRRRLMRIMIDLAAAAAAAAATTTADGNEAFVPVTV